MNISKPEYEFKLEELKVDSTQKDGNKTLISSDCSIKIRQRNELRVYGIVSYPTRVQQTPAWPRKHQMHNTGLK